MYSTITVSHSQDFKVKSNHFILNLKKSEMISLTFPLLATFIDFAQ